MSKNLDRFGNDRCEGYRMEDFELCPSCGPFDGTKEPLISCKICGGYGEITKKKAVKKRNIFESVRDYFS